MSKLDKIKQGISDWFNPPKEDIDIKLEEAHLKIINLINDDPKNPYVGANAALSYMAVERGNEKHKDKKIIRLLVTLLCIFVFSTVYLAASIKVVPWVVGMNQNGQIFDLNSSIENVKDSTIKNQLALRNVDEFIRQGMSVSPDGDVNNYNEEAVYSMAKGSAASYLNEYYNQNNSKEIAEKYSVSIQMNYTMHISAQTIKVSWTETRKNSKTSNVVSQQKYVGEFTYEWDVRSGNELIQRLNPLGFYVKSIVVEKDNG